MINKKNLFPILALTVIGVVVALLLAVVNMITAPVVAETERLVVIESLQTVMPGGDFDVEKELSEDTPETVQAIYEEKNGMGSVVILKVQGYASVISITVGIDNFGKVTRAIVTSEQESHGQSGMKNYPESFTGLDVGEVAGADLYTGATVSSRAIRGAIVDAMYALGYATDIGDTESGVISLPKSDSEIKALAESYVDGTVVKRELDEDAPKTIKRLYYHEPSGSFVAYVVTENPYNPGAVETDGFVVVNKHGVVTDAELLEWSVGNKNYVVEKPENFADTFIGKDKYSIVSAKLVTGATQTTTRFAGAVHDVILYTSEPDGNWQSIVGTVILSLAVVSVVAYTVIYRTRRKRK